MRKNVQEIVKEVNENDLTPGKPLTCPGNGEQGFIYHCHECDHILCCFPDFDKLCEGLDDVEIPEPSMRHKIRMNRIFRENVGGSFLPFPEVDCLYERVRSKIVVKLNINEFIEKHEKRRRKKQ
jgi:hypothetical protein